MNQGLNWPSVVAIAVSVTAIAVMVWLALRYADHADCYCDDDDPERD